MYSLVTENKCCGGQFCCCLYRQLPHSVPIVGYLLYDRYFVSFDFILHHCLLSSACLLCNFVIFLVNCHKYNWRVNVTDIWLPKRFCAIVVHVLNLSFQSKENFRCNFTFVIVCFAMLKWACLKTLLHVSYTSFCCLISDCYMAM